MKLTNSPEDAQDLVQDTFERAANYAGLDTLDAPAGWTKPSQEYLDNFTNEGAAGYERFLEAYRAGLGGVESTALGACAG